MRLEVTTWGDGKARVGLFLSEGIKEYKANGYKYNQETQDASLHYVAIDNGMGSYELFKDDKNLNSPVGEMVLFKTAVSLKLDETIEKIVKARDTYYPGGWNLFCSLSNSQTLKFNAVTPKCFNKRGKEIECPVIKF